MSVFRIHTAVIHYNIYEIEALTPEEAWTKLQTQNCDHLIVPASLKNEPVIELLACYNIPDQSVQSRER